MHSREQLAGGAGIQRAASAGLLEREGRGPILEMFSRASSFVYGRRVYVDLDGSTLHGTTAGPEPLGLSDAARR